MTSGCSFAAILDTFFLPVLYLVGMVKVGILVLFLILEEVLQFFSLQYNVTYGFVIYDLYYY